MISIDTNHNTTNIATVVWGKDVQLDILQEEAGEVVTAISRFERGRTGEDKVAEEIADFFVSSMSVIPLLKIEERVKYHMNKKLIRLQKRIDEVRGSSIPPDKNDINPCEYHVGLVERSSMNPTLALISCTHPSNMISRCEGELCPLTATPTTDEEEGA